MYNLFWLIIIITFLHNRFNCFIKLTHFSRFNIHSQIWPFFYNLFHSNASLILNNIFIININIEFQPRINIIKFLKRPFDNIICIDVLFSIEIFVFSFILDIWIVIFLYLFKIKMVVMSIWMLPQFGQIILKRLLLWFHHTL